MKAVLDFLAVECANANDICLKSLPRTEANGSTVQLIISIIIGVTAAVSVLFIAIGGMRYVLSQGEPQAITKAKSTIVYALIGLVVAILAQSIVYFVVKGITS